ncbi:ABC transporter permease [Pedobacter aquatilis]|uniref:ABC transporter permease n=1 Tax=Pedobacter aquatilis TaxID=351343 RepID=UPI0025B4D8D3|nr:FtsX-like permease family protein [Pedobacter aquatilis]MDN3587516.1 ABC transporter permease [Pedobacter aquatilis]
MFKHLFKLIWNKRAQNFLFLSEILISFLVVFAVFSYITYYYQNYSKPLGFDYNRVWAIAYSGEQLSKNPDTLTTFYANLEKNLKSMPEIKEVSFSHSNFPYSSSFMSRALKYGKKDYNMISHYVVSNNYNKVWNVELVDGRWFLPEDLVGKHKAIIINESLSKEMFGKEKGIGKVVGDDKEKLKIIGVINDFKSDGDFAPMNNIMFNQLDTGYLKWTSTVLIKVRETADANFESKLYKFMTNTTRSAVEIQHVDEMRAAKNRTTLIPIFLFIVVAGFLIINVALGLFGVLWYNINKRKGEIGLRRAIGASGSAVSSQMVMESIILTTISLIIGCFFAVQFPLLNVFNIPAGVYVIAIIIAIVFIYALVFACSLYPSKQAAAIHPAIALHED